MANNTYNLLTQLPLFKGVSREELTQIVGHTRLDFYKVEAGRIIVERGQPCQKLIFVLSGEYQVEHPFASGELLLREMMDQKGAIQTERLFGLHQHYTATFTALTGCHLMAIAKQDVIRLVEKSWILRLNLLNRLALGAQQRETMAWNPISKDLEHRLSNYITRRFISLEGHKMIVGKQQTLANELCCTRLNLSNILYSWQDKGLLRVHRRLIDIPDAKLLIID